MLMSKTISIRAIAFMMASTMFFSCGNLSGKGDCRDRNLEHAVRSHFDSESGVEYVGMFDVKDVKGGCSAGVIYYVADSLGNKVERNARVVGNDDFSKVYSWEDLNVQTLDEVKRKVTEEMKGAGINLDGSLIDALVELKKRAR